MPGEEILHFIWEHRLYQDNGLWSTCGKKLEVLRNGVRNHDSGPDFFNAQIRENGLVWAGNVEIHKYASDWYRHGHHEDPAFDNVILHLVQIADTEVKNSRGRRILAAVPHVPDQIRTSFTGRPVVPVGIPDSRCAIGLHGDHLERKLTCFYAERLHQKSDRMSKMLMRSGFDLEEAFYRALGSGFGLPINTLPFAMVTSAIPHQLLLDHSDSIRDLEALLFGQSGLLQAFSGRGTYASSLLVRYRLLSRSLREGPVPPHLWKFMRLRPASFPTLKLAQFASLIQHRSPLAQNLLGFSSADELTRLLRVRAGPYWKRHYLFGKSSPPLDKYIGKQFIRNLQINVVVPFLHALGESRILAGADHKAGEILSSLEAESNHIIEKWSKFGIIPRNAMESQGLIQLFKNYCIRGGCSDCPLGQDLRR